MTQRPAVGFIGFGEAGFTIGRGLRSAGIERLLAFDIATDSPERGTQIRQRAGEAGATLVDSREELARSSTLDEKREALEQLYRLKSLL